jgi:DUF4097 and DUF4098 domain-containing protein YvlB
MKTLIRASLLLSLTASLVGAQTVVGRNETTWSTRATLASGQRLRVTSPNGAITITQGSGSEVEIQVEKRAERNARIEDIGFIVTKSADGLVVCAVISDDDRCDLANGYESARNRWRDGWSTPRAIFTVRMPKGVMVQAETGNGDVAINDAGSDVSAHTGNGRVLITGTSGRVSAHTGNGRIAIEDAHGPVEATTGNGDVRVATSSGPVAARSGNGNIDVSMESVARAAEMTFSTGSGRIVLSVPANFGAELEGSTGNGEISSELPMRVEGRINPRRIRGTLGGGGERLAVSTGNGDIEIRKTH